MNDVMSPERLELDRQEAIIERGLRTFVEVGNALRKIRDGGLYTDGFPTFEVYIEERWPEIGGRRRAYQLMDAAEVISNVNHGSHGLLPINERQARPLTTLPDDQQAQAWQEAVETAPNGIVTAAHVQSVVDRRLPPTFAPAADDIPPDEFDDAPSPYLYVCDDCRERFRAPVWHCPACDHHYHQEDDECGNCHRSRSFVPATARSLADDDAEPETWPADPQPEYDGDEWYTPAQYLDAVREVLGGIDIDPASCPEAQLVVNAGQYFTKQDDALTRVWAGRVWLNPPYSFPLVARFVDHLLAEYEAGRVTAAILLTNNCTDASWFHKPLARFPVCFTRGRVSFWRPDRTVFATRQGQAFFYLGPDPETFRRVFTRFGVVVEALA